MSWTAVDAAKVAGLSPRTVQHWAKTGFYTPTLEWPPATRQWHYSLADAVALRCLRDALDAGAERNVAVEVAQEVSGCGWDWRSVAGLGWWAVFPTCAELYEATVQDERFEGELVGWLDQAPDEEGDGEGWLVWPASDRAGECVERAEQLHQERRTGRSAPWL